MNDQKLLEAELSWRTDGHVSDLVVSMMADGESDLIALDAAGHVDACPLCTERMLEMATLSFSLSEELSDLSFVPVAELRKVPVAPNSAAFPTHVFLLTVLVIAVATLLTSRGAPTPRVLALADELLTYLRGIRLVVPVVADHTGRALFALSLSSTFLCVVGGWLIARARVPAFAGRISG